MLREKNDKRKRPQPILNKSALHPSYGLFDFNNMDLFFLNILE
jgi:hypothetical protein